MDELNSLPAKEKIDFDSDNDQFFQKDDEKIQRNYNKHSKELFYNRN